MDYYSIDDINDYLEHHGILGQSWGHRNGPPYPLSSGKHSSSERKAVWRKSLKKKFGAIKAKRTKAKNKKDAEKRERLKREHSKDPNTMYKYRDEFTDEELRAAIARFGIERSLRELRSDKKLITYVNDGANFVKNLSTMTTNGIKLYNNMSDILDTFKPLNDGSERKYIYGHKKDNSDGKSDEPEETKEGTEGTENKEKKEKKKNNKNK